MTLNIDKQEIAKFSDLAIHWWDPQGELRTLHEINPLRLRFIQDKVKLAGKKIIDIGCGGGILAESMALVGGIVTGIDMSEAALKAAKLHRLETLELDPELKLHYEHCTAEEMAAKHPGTYEVVTCMEMLEHVPDPQSIIKACAALLKPGGLAFFSTLNRNLKSYLYAIIGAEYLLKILPKNTHDYSKFIRPSELTQWVESTKLRAQNFTGIHYDPFHKKFSLNEDLSVNYLMQAMSPQTFSLIHIKGQDAKKFLQGQVTCNLEELSPGQSRLGAHCNPQGRVLFLFRLFSEEESYYLVLPSAMLSLALSALKKYAVFFKLEISEIQPPEDSPLFLKAKAEWDYFDLRQGRPQIYPQTSGKFLPHDLNLHALDGLSWNKGCYTGQEIIARMHYRGKLKTHLYQLTLSSAEPLEPGSEIAGGTVVSCLQESEQSYLVLLVANENTLCYNS